MDYEKLGVFYLGKEYDIANESILPQHLLYESKDLTTHAVCVGMTGSGKTGLCISLLEEAAIDGIPVIAIDPKGDLSNLLLTFPNLKPEDFKPWIDPDEAVRNGCSVDEFSNKVASSWKNGLEKWEQDGMRINRFRDSADVRVLTPGSNSGIPVSVVKSFSAPSQAVMDDADSFNQCVSTSVSGILSLVGIFEEPLHCKEHILLSNIVVNSWKQKQDLNLPSLIRLIQKPPFSKIGFIDLETFYPESDRMEFAMKMNNLLASPAFSSWMEGETLNVNNLLYTQEGKPRISIFSISHLGDQERMFFVTMLLNEVLSWVRSQTGTSSLRAILYMDEVFGYFPPTANPPSKQPMLTLLKQARAFGLGVMLATQNPVDLDYKGLSNTGTWFIGRLQTERDKQRLLDGLESANTTAGHAFNRSDIDKILSSLGKRVFLMHNVHEDHPVVFQTRWALSYLRGPLTRQQITTLMADAKKQLAAESPPINAKYQGELSANDDAEEETTGLPPVISQEIPQRILAMQKSPQANSRLIYQAGVIAKGKIHYYDAKLKLSHWKDFVKIVDVDESESDDPWENAIDVNLSDIEIVDEPDGKATFDEPVQHLTKKTTYKSLERDLKSYIYREEQLVLSYSPDFGIYSTPDEPDVNFKARLQQSHRENRDLEMEKLKSKYAPKLAMIKDKIKRAEERVDKEAEQSRFQTMNTTFSIGASILGALFGRKLTTRTNATSMASAVRNATRTSKERNDVSRAKDSVSSLEEELADLESELKIKLDELEALPNLLDMKVEEYPVSPRKADITVDEISLAWLPYSLDSKNKTTALFM